MWFSNRQAKEKKGNYNALYQEATTVVTGNCGMGITDAAKWFKSTAVFPSDTKRKKAERRSRL